MQSIVSRRLLEKTLFSPGWRFEQPDQPVRCDVVSSLLSLSLQKTFLEMQTMGQVADDGAQALT